MKRVLFTGHGGFVGHHCLDYFLNNTDWELICIDSFRHKGTPRRVVEVTDGAPTMERAHAIVNRFKSYKHDLTVPFDRALENLIFERKIDSKGVVTEKPIHYIINMASESAVERSTVDPTGCLRNNFELGLNMLEFARKCPGLEMFLQVSTDEVYGEAAPNVSHKEWAPINPSNPYAASKAAQEAMAISYWRTYKLPLVLLNCMNVIGERQDPEKFLPKVIQKLAKNEQIDIYGEDANTIGSRIYLDAQNMASAIAFLSKTYPTPYYNHGTGEMPDRYNICGDVEINNLQFAALVARMMGKKKFRYRLVPSESARPGYDRRYALDGSKLLNVGWKPPSTFEQTVERIVKWTLENPHWIL